MSAQHKNLFVVTGAANGIGAAAAALAVEEEHGVVVLLDRDRAAVTARADALRGEQGECVAIPCDIGNEEQVCRAFTHIRSQFPQPIRLVCAAGIDRGAPADRLDVEAWDAVMRVNLRGTFLCCREAVRATRGRGGAIVCISSPFALVSAPNVGAYAASKAGVCALVRSFAIDCAEQDVRVNALLPGPTETELMWANVPPEQRSAMRAVIRREVPLRRLAEPEEIARIALWLISDSAAYITGAQLACDGGLLAKAPISI
jgi:NAD(P)-dependent dehydrogenase (short-subunit alcohol dehydrogenase family)